MKSAADDSGYLKYKIDNLKKQNKELTEKLVNLESKFEALDKKYEERLESLDKKWDDKLEALDTR